MEMDDPKGWPGAIVQIVFILAAAFVMWTCLLPKPH